MPKQKLEGRTLPDLPFDMPDEKPEAGTSAAPATTVEELRAQLAALQNDLKTQRETNLALMTQAPVTAPQPKPTDVNMDNLPDPVQDPVAYGRELLARQRTALQNEEYNKGLQQQQQQTSAARVQALWEDFVEAYPEYAKDTEKAQFAANAVVQRALARGRDADKYMFGASRQFFEDAVKHYDKTFGKPGEGASGDDADEDDSPDNRALGLPGGGPSGRSKAPSEDDLPQTTTADSLRQWQQKTGFSI